MVFAKYINQANFESSLDGHFSFAKHQSIQKYAGIKAKCDKSNVIGNL
jgi:hypothetical protein